jgi:hypothetical protein
MLKSDAYGEALGFHLHSLTLEHAIDIACAMTSGKDDGTDHLLALGCAHTYDLVGAYDKLIDTGLKSDLAAMLYDSVAHVFYYSRQAVGAYVGMGGGEDVGAGAMLAEDAEYAANVSAFSGAGVKFAIGIGSGASLAEGVVALGVDDALSRDECYVLLALVDILASLQHHGAQSQFDES